MANTKQARKRARQAVARNQHLSAQRVAGDKAAASEAFVKAQKIIDTMAGKNVLHKNAAARHKSRLAAAIKAMA